MAYTPKVWAEDDPITPAELNRLEERSGGHSPIIEADTSFSAAANQGTAFPAGVWYFRVAYTEPNDTILIEVFINGAWRELPVSQFIGASEARAKTGLVASDGSNVRVWNSDPVTSFTVRTRRVVL
jgi:hypothetical protein